MKTNTSKKWIVILVSILMVFSLLSFAACEMGTRVSLSLEKEEYHAEFGERFFIPEPIVEGISASDVAFEVKDEDGNVVTKAALGSFYPEVGTYTVTYTYEKKSVSAKIICADTKGPSIDYTDYVKTVFEGEIITVPTFVANDASGMKEESASLKIYKGLEGSEEVAPDEDNLITAEVGAKAYRFIYTVEDIHSNVGSVELITEVKEDFIDEDIAQNYIWDFDEEKHLNLIGEHTGQEVITPSVSIATDGVDGIDGGALKLSASGDGVYAGVNILHGKSVNTGDISRIIMRVYADNDITILTISALREDLANIEFADLAKGQWHDLEINPRALYPDAIDVNHLEVSFRVTGDTNFYIDGIYSVPFFTDENLAENVLGDFDEEGYLANIEQAGYDIGKGLVSAEYRVIAKEDLEDGALKDGADGGVLKVNAYDVWAEDYGGYGVLGDGFKYYLPEPINTADINQMFIKFYCASGNGLALSFCYEDPTTKVTRSKARWMRGVEGEWVTLSISQEMITQIVPMHPTFDADDNPITHFNLTSIIITSCGNVPEHTPCTEFYVDEISFVGDFVDENLDSANNVLGDFDESGYIANLDQAWIGATNTAVYKVLPEGNDDVPAGAKGGVVKVNANQAVDVIYPMQGAQGDGIRFYLFNTMSFDDIESITIRALGVEGKGTAINVGFVIERNGERMISNAWWQQVKPGEWSDITLDRARLTHQDEDPKTGEMIPRIQKGDILLGVRIWACAVQTDLEWAKEFYIDEISYADRVSVDPNPDPDPENKYDIPTSTDPLGENVLIDFTHKGDDERLSQGSYTWGAQENGGAEFGILTNALQVNAKIYEFDYFNADRQAVFKTFTGSVLEVYSRTNTMDSATITFDEAYALDGKASLNLTIFSNDANAGYVVYIVDSNGTGHAWRIKAADYLIYTWSDLELSIATLKEESKLVDIKSITFAFGCAQNNASYLYVKPITFTAETVEEPPVVEEPKYDIPTSTDPLGENVLIDFTHKGDDERLSQGSYTWGAQENGGAEFGILTNALQANAKIYEFDWFKNNETRINTFKSFTGSVLEVYSRANTMDSATITFDEAYALDGKASLNLTIFSNDANAGYVVYIVDSNGTGHAWRVAKTDYTIYTWSDLELSIATLKEQSKLVDIKSITFAFGCAQNNASYLYVKPITFTEAEIVIPEEPLPENVLIDFTRASDADRISQSTLMWNGQTNGGATYGIITKENEATAAIYNYHWFDSDTKKNAFRSFEGSVLEIASRAGKMDGAKITFDTAYSFDGRAAINVEFFSNASNSGYVFYIEDSNGKSHAWRIQTTDYAVYTWKTLSITTETLKSAGLTDVKAISIAYACGTGDSYFTHAYTYVKPITFTEAEVVVPEEPLPENVLIDFTRASDADRISQSTLMWNGQTNGGATYGIITKENEATAKIYGYHWFDSDTKKNAFRSFEGSVLEIASRAGKMDGAKITFDTAYSFDGRAAVNVEFFSNTANGGYVFYIEDSNGKSHAWRIQTTDYAVYTWKTLSITTETLKSAGLTDVKAISIAYACGTGDSYFTHAYTYVKPITFTEAQEEVVSNVLIDFTAEGDADRISQSTLMWEGQTNGGATYSIISRENEATAKIYGYHWFDSDTKKNAFRSFEGSVLEIASRAGKMDGAKITFDTAYSFDGRAAINVEFFSNASNNGYVFYIEDSNGKSYAWRIQTTDYAVYTWKTLSITTETLKSAGLVDVKAISIAYACGTGDSYFTHAYTYVKPITFTNN